jgi:hypothetical protein
MKVYSARYTGRDAERVQICLAKIQLFVFTIARMIPRKVGGPPNSAPVFPSRVCIMCMKYVIMVSHHLRIRLTVPVEHGASFVVWPYTIFSIISPLYRLYGTMQSGSSWWILLHPSHFNRLITNICFLSSLLYTTRFLTPRISNCD